MEAELSWSEGINILSGPNGSGKTNIVDAIHHLCMGRSFVASTDTYSVTRGQSSLKIEGKFSGSIRSSFRSGLEYARGKGKQFFVNGSPVSKIADIIGMVPVVVLNPDDKLLTKEGPSERRSFLDSMIAQLSKPYLANLIEYRKIIKQRNALLSDDYWKSYGLDAMLEPWDQQLAKLGAEIITARREHLKKFAVHLDTAYQQLSGLPMKPAFQYKTVFDLDEHEGDLEQPLLEALKQHRSSDINRGSTYTGPHRDELVFFLDDMELRRFGSQGQHRIFVMSLKLAQLLYYSEVMEEMPVLILDDVFGDLDTQKIKILLHMLNEHPGQVFITVANSDLVLPHLADSGRNALHYYFEEGNLFADEEKLPVRTFTHS